MRVESWAVGLQDRFCAGEALRGQRASVGSRDAETDTETVRDGDMRDRQRGMESVRDSQ